MKFGVVVFPGSNCDRDMYDALSVELGQDVSMLWHKDRDLGKFSEEDCIILPGGFSYGDYLRCGAIAIEASSSETISDSVERLKTAQWSERGEGRRSRAPAGENAADSVTVDRFDVPDDLNGIEWRAVDQKMLRQLLAACRRALKRHQ